MAKASDNPFPSLLLVEQSATPATPSAGQARLYRGSDGKLYVVDDADTVTEFGGGSTSAGDTTWTVPTLTNSWALNTGTGNPPVGFRKDASGFVHIRGIIKGGASGTVAFTLPVGYRPAYDIAMSTAIGNSGGTANISDLIVIKAATGGVQVNTAGPWVWMPAGAFLAEQ